MNVEQEAELAVGAETWSDTYMRLKHTRRGRVWKVEVWRVRAGSSYWAWRNATEPGISGYTDNGCNRFATRQGVALLLSGFFGI